MPQRNNPFALRSRSLFVEHLESRLVPSASPFAPEPLIVEDPVSDPSIFTSLPNISTVSQDPLVTWTKSFHVDPARLNHLAGSLIGSPEFLGNQVDLAYQRILGRSSGPGRSMWVEQLRNGSLDSGDLSVRFIASEEFLATMDYNAKNMVKFIFTNYLDRNPAENGLEHWVSRLERLSRTYLYQLKPGEFWLDAVTPPSDPNYATAQDPFFVGLAPSNRTPEQTAALKLSLEKIASEIRATEESRFNQISLLYKGILHRDPSTMEIGGWKQSGLSETKLIQRFIGSVEFQKQFQSVQELVAGAYSEILFRPAGTNGLKSWSKHLGASANDDTWVHQISGVRGVQGALDDKKLDKVLQLVYANGVTNITTDELRYHSRFDPNLLVRVGGTRIRAAAPEGVPEPIPAADRKAFWERVGKGTWDPESSGWKFTYDASLVGGTPGETQEFLFRSDWFHDGSDPSGQKEFLEGYQLGSWSGFIHGVDAKLPPGWNGDRIYWSVNLDGGEGDDSWQCQLPVDPWPPLVPWDGFSSTFADLNADGVIDEITTLRGDMFPGAETLVQVYFGQAMALPGAGEPVPKSSEGVGEVGGSTRPSLGLEGLFDHLPGFGEASYPEEPSYTFAPYKGYSGRVTVAAGDFDGDGKVELVTAPRDHDLFASMDSAFPGPEGKLQVSLFHGQDGSFLGNVPLPADMAWKVWKTETDPSTNVLKDQLVDGIDGLVVGAGALTAAGHDQLILATGGQNAQVWIGNPVDGASGPQWTWTSGPLAENQNVHQITLADVNFDGQLDIGLNATKRGSGPISIALYIPPKTIWFDGKTFEPISFSQPGETIFGPDGNVDKTWVLGVFENLRKIVQAGGDNKALLEGLLKPVVQVIASLEGSGISPHVGVFSGMLDGVIAWIARPETVDSLLSSPEVNSALEELRTILGTEDYKDLLAKYLETQLSSLQPAA